MAFVARPTRMLATAILLSSILTGGALVGYAALGPEIQSRFTIWQLLTLIAILAILDGLMLGAGLSFVRADASGLRFRNGLSTRKLPWEAVRGFRLLPGDPWAYVVLDPEFSTDTHERYMLLGIQGSEGVRAQRQVEQLRHLWRAAHQGRKGN